MGSNYKFKELTSNCVLFFELLPQDWQDEIVPYWDTYKSSSTIYIIEDHQKIIGGGIIFSKCPPDLMYYENEADEWFKRDFKYIGFLWVNEDKRNCNLGSFWLDEIKCYQPNQNFWLVIEEERLQRFYEKNNFKLKDTLCHNDRKEWLYTYQSKI